MPFEGLAQRLDEAFKKLTGRGKLNEKDIKDAMREVRVALLEADVNYLVVKDFIKKVSERSMGEEILQSLTPGQQVIKIVNEELTQLMGGQNAKLEFGSTTPSVILLCGLQGAGKTTMAAKLGGMLRRQGKRPMLVACDIYRPAAIDQLKVMGAKVEVPVFEMGQQDVQKITRAALEKAVHDFHDVVIIDTAGRLHIDQELMMELQRIKALAKPAEILLVVDSMTGQDAVNVAETFNNQLGVTGIILSKLDSDTRGGVALSVRQVTGRPIKFCGMGEKVTDIEPFYPDRMASRILGMGDVLTLIEKAQTAFDEKEAAQLEQKLRKNEFTLEDFLDQLKQMRKMGGMQELIGMLPGAQKLGDVQVDEKAMARTEAIVLSMTGYERRNPNVLNASRKRRVARGSGTSVQEINRLLKQFEQIQQMVKQMGGKGKKRMRMPFM